VQKKLREETNQQVAKKSIQRIKEAAQNQEPLIPIYVDAANADVTLGEMVAAVEEAIGRYQYTPTIPRVR
jgi:methylmalonyl-CoA mutase N-terminal domain/subunit